MDIDLDIAYFFNTEHWNLEKKYQQELDKRERKCRKKGMCLDLLNRKPEDGGKVKEGKAEKAK